MTSLNEMLQQIANPDLTNDERARLRCELAKEMEASGNYEAAREAMGELWSHVGDRPNLSELSDITAAEVLLRAGALTGRIGSFKQIEGAQEIAKNLVSESLRRFEAVGEVKKVGEAQVELGNCYWREGAYDEARTLLQNALIKFTDVDSELRAKALLLLALIDCASFRLSDALRILTEAAPLFENSSNHTLIGIFHNELATVLKNLGAVEHRRDYVDRALIEYAAASYHFEQAGHRRYQGCVENNLGMLFSTIGKFEEAHEHLDRAQALFTSLKDTAHLAGVDETRARVFLAEGKVVEAERLARGAVSVLERGGEQALLAEALTTQGKALAVLGKYNHARLTLQRAVEVAESAGDKEGAGQAALTIIEMMGERLSFDDLSATYERAHDLLSETQHPGLKDRLLACARLTLHLSGAPSAPSAWGEFSFERALHRYEARLIERALRDAGGVIAQAARFLKVKRQSLSNMLHQRHKNLLSLRNPVPPRRYSLMFRSEGDDTFAEVSVLYVEDNAVLADAVREMFEAEGWEVSLCDDGSQALRVLESEQPFDAIIFDYQLPGVDGLQLLRRARTLAHRRRTPIVMLSASDVEAEARRFGVSAYLRKPQEVGELPETLARLLAKQGKE